MKKKIPHPDGRFNINHLKQQHSMKSLNTSLVTLPGSHDVLNLSLDVKNIRPDPHHLTESFSTPYLHPMHQYDESVYKILPSLKKKHLPGAFLSVKHADEIINIPKSSKKKLTKKVSITSLNDFSMKTTKNYESQKIIFPQFESALTTNPIDEIPNNEEFETSVLRIKAKSVLRSHFEPVIDPISPNSLIKSKKSPANPEVSAYSKWFNTEGKYIWKKCTVMGYKTEADKFEIMWPEGNKKLVSRINLRFEDEDQQIFEKRVSEAQKYKNQTEEEILKKMILTNLETSTTSLATKVFQMILEYLQGKNTISLNKYRNTVVFYSLPAEVIHNPCRFLWKNQQSHFIDETQAYKSKNFKDHSEFVYNFIESLTMFALFTYSPQNKVMINKASLKKLILEVIENWTYEIRNFDYMLKGSNQEKLIMNINSKNFSSQTSFKIKGVGVPKFLKALNSTSQNYILNDANRLQIAKQITDILLIWKTMNFIRIQIPKNNTAEDFIGIIEINFIEFIREAQNAIFDVQYEIQEILSVEDYKRIERNQQKLKARAHSQQFIELEECLPEETIRIYKKFLRVCNMRIEDSLRKKIFDDMDLFINNIKSSIFFIYDKLNEESILPLSLIEEASSYAINWLSIELKADVSKKNLKFDDKTYTICEEIVSRINNSLKEIEKIKCLSSSQTGPVHDSEFINIIRTFPAKYEKKLDLLDTCLKKQFLILKSYLSHIEKYAYILKIKPSEYARKLDKDIQKIENEINKMKKTKDEVSEILGETNRQFGIWSVNVKSVKNLMNEILNKTIDELIKVLQDECLKKAKELQEYYFDIKSIIGHNPSNLEELDEIREYIKNDFEEKMKMIREGNSKLMKNISILESFWKHIPYDLYRKSWNCLSFSKNLTELKTKCLKNLNSSMEVFSVQLSLQTNNVLENIKSMISTLNELKKEDDYLKHDKNIIEFKVMQKNIEEATEVVKIVLNREEIVGRPPTDFGLLEDLKKTFNPYWNLWNYIHNFFERHPSWINGPINLLHREAIANELNGILAELSRMERIEFKHEPPALKLVKDFTVEINEFKPFLPVIKCVNNPGMKERHWAEFFKDSKIEIQKNPSICLNSLWEMGILEHTESLERVSDIASKEHNLEITKRNMELEWNQIKFDVISYKSSYILINTEIIGDLLDEHLMRVQAIILSPFVTFMINEVNHWNSNLLRIQDILEEWIKFQKHWQYLLPIFMNNDISKQLPQSSYKFKNINSKWENIMNSANHNRNVYEFCMINTKIFEILSNGNEILDSILKSLNEYLMSKRRAFPRFYFLSNDELVTILSNSQDIITIQRYIIKCFEAISGVIINSQSLSGMISPEGEKVEFQKAVGLYHENEIKSIEVWLLDLEREMHNSLKKLMKKSLSQFSFQNLEIWARSWPSQLIHACTMSLWTYNVENSIIHNTLAEVLSQESEKLNILVKAVRGDLEPLDRLTFSTMVVINVHNQDIIENLVKKQVSNVSDFSWFCNMRYYLRGSKMIIKMLDCTRDYGYEYLGNTGRLVITQLTDRCYRTLMTALNMSLGGAPEGPAGTGKTETVKDLAKTLAKKCVVFNCSDRLDHIYMAKFFTGLCYCGAWACFDEFNRIELDVLSVIAEQILSIQTAVQKKENFLKLDDENIQLNPTCAVFITMNPDYAGRTKLPNNLKALFRPVAMMIPDYAMIAEIYLYSFGFLDARTLACKIIKSLKLASEQLSTQQHYDYGMRAVSTIIKAAGWIKEKNIKDNEEQIILKAIKMTNVPKFLNQDLPLFNGIILDLFPKVTERPDESNEILEALNTAITESSLIENPKFLAKVLEIYNTILIRHGIMIVGETMSGKSTAISILGKALSYKNPVSSTHINPKAITLAQLYGAPDPNSQDWKDGILGQSIRLYSESSSKGFKWIVLDGPVDAIWIESLNTVLDDNKKLCLSSGEIIKITETIKILFEINDLSNASPATISRCGMIYLDGEDIIGPNTLINQWIKYPPHYYNIPRIQSLFNDLFNTIFFPALEYWKNELKSKQITNSTTSYATRSMINLFQSFIIKKGKSRKQHDNEVIEENLGINNSKHKEMNDEQLEEKHQFHIISTQTVEEDIGNKIDPQALNLKNSEISNLFVMAVLWSLGGTCDEEGRRLCAEYISTISAPFVTLPQKFHKFFYQISSNSWEKWENLLTNPVKDSNILSILVPTTSLVTYKFLLNELIPRKINTIVMGETGTGKTLLLKSYVSELDQKYYKINFTMFSGRTSSGDVQNFLESKTIKRRKGFYGADIGKFCVFVIDDLNMPTKETFGSQPSIELLRKIVEKGDLLNRNSLEVMILEDVQFIGAMGNVSGGRNLVSNRFLSHFFLMNFANYTTDSLFIILSTLLKLGFENHDEVILNSINSVTKGIIQVYFQIISSLPPTPTKSHYTFNLRDLSSILKGMFSVPPHKLKDTQILMKLWVHECLRVFSDRLICETDKAIFLDILKKGFSDCFSEKWEELIIHEPMFSNFITNDKKYQEVVDKEKLKKHLDNLLQEYISDIKRNMNLLFFEYAVEHICRISRVIAWECGNLLLIGLGGSGRMSLTRLSAFIFRIETFQIKLTRSYGLNDWIEELKTLLTKAGQKLEKIVFILRDNEIIQEAFLESINNILNTGQSPNIFTADEIKVINESLKMNKNYTQLTDAQRWDVFANNIKKNLHIVLIMFPQGETMRARIRQFPSLVNCCTIDLFTEWPTEALSKVAEFYLKTEKIVEIPEKLEKAINILVCFHESVQEISHQYLKEMKRYNYVTPSHFLKLLNTIKKIYKSKEESIIKEHKKYSIGIQQLDSTQVHVQKLREVLIEMKPALEKKTLSANETLKEIQKENAEADITRSIVASEQKSSAEQTAIAENIRKECHDALSIALPELEAARKALDTIRREDIDLVKTMHNPPDAVKLTLEALAITNKLKPVRVKDPLNPNSMIFDYYEAGKKMLSIPKFIKKLKAFDRESIDEETITKIAPYMELPKFHPDVVKYASSAAEGLCKWVRAMFNFYHVNKVVKPKRASLDIAEENLKEKMKLLKYKQEQLSKVEEFIMKMQNKLELQMAETTTLSDQINKVEVQMDRAVKLIHQLGGEGEAWANKVKQCGTNMVNLLGDSLLSAAIVTYLGPFMWSYREKCLQQKWLPLFEEGGLIEVSQNFSLNSTIGEPLTLQNWMLKGLPSDKVSIENAITIYTSLNYPLIIDPQGQALKWLNKMLGSSKKLTKLKSGAHKFNSVIENALLSGADLMIEGLEENVDPVLDPILLKQFYTNGSMRVIEFGDSVKPFDDNFFLYLFTSHPNPHFSPEISIKTTILNFTITEEALGEQLLDLVCKKEIPRDTEEKNRLTIQSVEYFKKIHGLEDRILEMLKAGGDNILESEELINSLTESKEMAMEVEKKLINSKNAEQRIKSFQANYSPAGKLSAILYFCISDLSNIDPMYKYSMNWFIVIFKKSLSAAEKSKDIGERVKNITAKFRELIYFNIYHSLHERDRILFVLLITMRLLLYEKQIQDWQWRYFLTGVCGVTDSIPNPTDYLLDKTWRDVVQLDIKVNGFCQHIIQSSEIWKKFIQNEIKLTNLPNFDEFSQILPEPYGNYTTHITRLLIFRAIKPEILGIAVKAFVKSVLGEIYLSPAIFSLGSAFAETSCLKPLIFILTSGSDPQSSIKRYTNEIGVNLKSVSLGKGQGDRAEKVIRDSTVDGSWVLLQNCHLSLSWLGVLENILEEISMSNEKAENINKNFRLILTTMPAEGFPANLLQKSVKVVAQPAGGLRNSLLGIYTAILESKEEKQFYTDCKKPSQWNALFFSLSFFHCVVRERRNFGAIGWNISYEFNESDLFISSRQLKEMIENFEEPPFEALIHLTASCNYGGRVTDDWDRRALREILISFYNEKILEGNEGLICPFEGYRIPKNADLEEISALIKSFPQVQSAETFGLHLNAELSKAKKEAYDLCSQLLTLQPRSVGILLSEQKSRIFTLADIILEKIRDQFDVESIRKKYPINYLESMNTVLIQELGRYNNLIDLIKSSLGILKKAHEGLIVITPEYEILGESLLDNIVPVMWKNNSYASCKSLLSWIEDLRNRLNFFEEWIQNNKPPVFWISGFYFTQSFLTAVLQEYSRKQKLPIDTINFGIEVLNYKPENSPDCGAYIHGLFLEGATWDGDALAECKPRELICEFPIVNFM